MSKFKTQEEFTAYADALLERTVRLKKVWRPDEKATKIRMRAFMQWNINRFKLLQIFIYSPEKMRQKNKYSTDESLCYLEP